MSDNVGRRPDGPGAYHYEDDSNLMDCLVHYNQEGTRLQALWVGNDRFLPGYPTDKWRFIDNMPGDFVPLTKPVAAPEPDWSQAPEWAMWWAVDTYSDSYWFEYEPSRNDDMWFGHYPGKPPLRKDGKSPNFAGRVGIPLGLDWRTTLRKRPEVGDE